LTPGGHRRRRSGTVGAVLEGIDQNGVTAWYRANLAPTEPPLRFERLPGGHSNLTYRVTDGAGRVTVLRRPPLGELLPSAHDMSREHRAISALGPTPVPVPPALGFCDDRSVTGAPFYVMGYVEGRVLHTEEDAVDALGEPQRRRAGESLAEVAAALHAVDVDAVGLSNLGKPDAYVARQMKRWYGQYQASRGATALIDRLHDDLAARVPAQQRVSMVHGDYRLGNCITAATGDVAAVLDWEICTLGDPLADVGYLLATWSEPGDTFTTISTSPSRAPGFPSRAEMLANYAARSDLDTSGMPYYLAFSYWKLACINQGVWARYDAGQKSSEGVDVDAIRDSVDRLAELSAAALDELG
jgi:aminoglycoside phosphotransferase (APT) family kinase protein